MTEHFVDMRNIERHSLKENSFMGQSSRDNLIERLQKPLNSLYYAQYAKLLSKLLPKLNKRTYRG